MFKREVHPLIAALFFLSAGGLLLHLRIHPPSHDAYNWIPAIFGVFTTFVLPFLFNYRKTVPLAFMLNVITVVVGTVTMAWYSATHWAGTMPVTFVNLLLQTTFADILILFVRLPIGFCILRHFYPRNVMSSAAE